MQDNLDIKLMRGGYTKRNIVLNSQIKLSIVLVLIFLLKTNFLVSELLYNIGLPYLRFQKLFFFILPGIYIYFTAKANNKISLKNFSVVLVFVIIQYLLEYYHGYSGIEGEMDYINRWIYIYLGGLILINVGVKYLEFILKSVITLVLINSSLIYLDILGLINIADISIGTDSFSGRLNSTINLNLFSDINILAVFCLYWLSFLKLPTYTFFKIKIPKYFYMIFLVSLTFIQSTRGSLLLLISGVLIFTYFKWNYWKLEKKIFILFGIILLLLIQSNISALLIDNFSIFERFNNSSTNVYEAEEMYDGRFLQIISSFENFLKNPIIGVGHQNSTLGVYEGILRSNFQYTQILASGGLILFGSYFFMIFRLFGYSLKLINHDLIVKSCIIFILIALTFRRPDSYFAILSCVVFYRRLVMNSKRL
jgi:hypothetical protein